MQRITPRTAPRDCTRRPRPPRPSAHGDGGAAARRRLRFAAAAMAEEVLALPPWARMPGHAVHQSGNSAQGFLHMCR